jgi:predicted Holliday junction resolvase-like endonuclease
MIVMLIVVVIIMTLVMIPLEEEENECNQDISLRNYSQLIKSYQKTDGCFEGLLLYPSL